MSSLTLVKETSSAFELWPSLSEFDKFKIRDNVYIIEHGQTHICHKSVSCPTAVREFHINRMVYQLADSKEAYSSEYTSINFYLNIELVANENSDFFGQTSAEPIQEVVAVELYYHISPKPGYVIPFSGSTSIYGFDISNNVYSIDFNRIDVRPIYDESLGKQIFLSKDEALEEFHKQSDAAAYALKEVLDIGAKYISQSWNKLEEMQKDFIDGTKLLTKFIESQCTKDFPGKIRNTDDWLFVYLHEIPNNWKK